MEAGGVASACFQSPKRPGSFMVRGVSDLADNNKGTDSVEQWRAYAAEVAATYAISLLSSGPLPIEAAASEFKRHTDHALQNPRLQIPGLQKSIRRNEIEEVEDQLGLGMSVVLTGEAGTGKTGIGQMLATAARSAGKEVLLLDARLVEHVNDEAQLRNTF